MSKRRCRLCSNFAIEGSIFCEQHRERAQLFARRFAAGETTATSMTEQEHEAAAEPVSPAKSHEASPPNPDESPLERAVGEALARIVEQAKTRSDSRWPQISIYFIGDK